MKIKLSKSQWESIGKKAGWTKTAQFYDDSHDVESFRYEGETDDVFRARLLKNKQMSEQEHDRMSQRYSELVREIDELKRKLDERMTLIENINQWLDRKAE